MNTFKLFKAFSLASAVTISLFSMNLMNQKSASAVDVTPNGWCIHSGSYIVFGNFDGKGGRDALCADDQGSKWINYANGKRWYTKTSWCTHPGSRIKAIRLNNDNRYDLECQNRDGSVVQRREALPNGRFNF
ncbi:hypothetical protein [Nostoc sp.]|uniref:hypothetical protein n=1 Tax=Nostoc sp. TaxID=1180 RepID=UPI002FFB4579